MRPYSAQSRASRVYMDVFTQPADENTSTAAPTPKLSTIN